ncbi:MAG TPA: hypothetical protein VD731_04980 [Nitrosopumilaceae archaeon]|nr:hypothetical protein [Nitrosopumilaceae archaeon]
MKINIELCNDGMCKRVRLGEMKHRKHGFNNNFLKSMDNFWLGVGIVMILLISLIPFFHYGPDLGLEDKDKWTITFALFAIIVSFAVAMTNLHFKKLQLQTSSLFKVFELLSSPEIRNSRKAVHDKYHEFTKDEKKIFSGTTVEKETDVVLSSFDQVSAMVLNRLLDKDLFFDTYGEMIVRDWKTLEDEIVMRQKKNKKTLRHFTELKVQFEEMLQKDKEYKDLDTDPY